MILLINLHTHNCCWSEIFSVAHVLICGVCACTMCDILYIGTWCVHALYVKYIVFSVHVVCVACACICVLNMDNTHVCVRCQVWSM